MMLPEENPVMADTMLVTLLNDPTKKQVTIPKSAFDKTTHAAVNPEDLKDVKQPEPIRKTA
jgi:hypothetical protein